MKYLSIITNFEGAHISVPATTISSLEKLPAAVKFEKAEGISVLGGGDPLFEYENHKKYYQRLFRACREMKLPLEVHTTFVESEFPYEKCAHMVYHLHDFDQVTHVIRHGNEKVRVVFVVDKSCTLDTIDKVADFCESSDAIDGLCFRLRTKTHRPQKCCYDYIRNGFGTRWTYSEGPVDEAPYFVNGVIYYEFADISM